MSERYPNFRGVGYTENAEDWRKRMSVELTPIPKDIQEAADRFRAAFCRAHGVLIETELIAQALLAEREAATKAERERCARLLEGMAASDKPLPDELSPAYEAGRRFGLTVAAPAAIRSTAMTERDNTALFDFTGLPTQLGTAVRCELNTATPSVQEVANLSEAEWLRAPNMGRVRVRQLMAALRAQWKIRGQP